MATIKDVAKEAGVAVGTVSKVINNIPVKPETKVLVEEAIKKLKYIFKKIYIIDLPKDTTYIDIIYVKLIGYFFYFLKSG